MQKLNNQKGFGALEGILLVILLAAVGAAGYLAYQSRHKTSSNQAVDVSTGSPSQPITANEKTFSFMANFYKNAYIENKNNKTYVISKDSQGQQTGLWVDALPAPLSCNTAHFAYQSSYTVVDSCYFTNESLYVSDISISGQVYQINMTSQRPVSLSDAQAIFSSVQIH